jgi:chemotaxis protein methyltransferase CheR
VRNLSYALGLDLTSFRPEHVAARVGGILARMRIPDASALARAVAIDPALRTHVRRSIAISVTRDRRDAGQFEALRRLHGGALRASGRPARAWCAGCSTGAEVRDLAETLREARVPVAEVLGSDLLDENVAAARRAHGDVPEARWEVRDVVADGPPAGAWDVVVSRNVAIYLTTAAKARLHATLAEALAPGGILLLGRAERLPDTQVLGLRRAGPHLYRRAA